MPMLATIFDWFTGGSQPYHTLFHCMRQDTFWITVTVTLDLAVAAGYVVIAMHWWKNSRHLPPIPAKRALGTMRNIFLFCGICGYLFIPIKMFWPAWRLYDMFLAFLVYYTWRYAWNAKNLKVIYNELGRGNRLAEDLEKSKADLRRKSFFLNAVSHDLRTPLNSLMLQANLAEIAMASGDTQTVQEAVSEIKAGAKATANLLHSFLEYARVDWSGDRNKVDRVEIATLLLEIVQQSGPIADEKGLYLRGNCPAGLTISTDRAKLERILQNLIGNALKFTDCGGVRVEVERAGPAIAVHVIDTGIGIPAEGMEHLFEEFFQVSNNERDRRKGFGLGLAIARRLAQQLGGDITVDSAVGKGSRFSVTLPGVAPAVGEATAAERSSGGLEAASTSAG